MNGVNPPENLPVAEPVFLIEVDKISPNPLQPRKLFDEESIRELAVSIREFGILQPLVVRKIEEATETGTKVRYELIAGERRLRAAQHLALDRVPAIIKSVDLERTRLEMAIVENVQRTDLNPIEAARAYSRLQDEFRLTQREIASKIGKSREVIANTLRLLNLPSNIQEAITRGDLSESQARLLLSIEEPKQQEQLFTEILKNHLSVRGLRSRIAEYKKPAALASGEGEPRSSDDEREKLVIDPETVSMQKELEEFLGAPVKLEKSGTTGKITIQFYSPEELRALVAKMTHLEETGLESTKPPEEDEKEGEEKQEPFYI